MSFGSIMCARIPAGRPLTKKNSWSSSPCQLDEDEGYGASPVASITSPPDMGDGSVFTFTSVPHHPDGRMTTSNGEADEWSLLEREINMVCRLSQPSTHEDSGNILIARIPHAPSYSPKTPKSPIKASPPRGNGCQFCAKNGEIRSVVS